MRRPLLIFLLLAGCTAWRPMDERADAGDAGADGGASDAGTSDAGTSDGGRDGGGECPPPGEREPLVLDEDITTDTRFTCANDYVVEEQIFVTGGSEVTIDPGVTFRFAPDTTLVFERDSRIRAVGTPESPIVFTSETSGVPWVGIALAGRATVRAGGGIQRDPYDRAVVFGGTDDAYDCGTMRYVRIEWGAGEHNLQTMGALALEGCGAQTSIDHIQIHGAEFEGLEIDGGTVRPHHIAITDAGDEAIRVQDGWRGGIQYLLVHTWHDTAVGMQIDSDEGTPSTRAWFANATFIGVASLRERSPIALEWSTGAGAVVTNSIVMGWAAAIDLDEPSWALVPDNARVERTFFHDNDGLDLGPADDTDLGRDEAAEIVMPAGGTNLFDDPDLVDPYVPGSPSYLPASDTVTIVGCPPTALDPAMEPACYAGAFADASDDWMAGWTAFPTR
jgi:hypothetical protein